VEEDINALHPSGGDSLCLHPRLLRFLVNRLNSGVALDRVNERVRSSLESAKNDRCSR
jgi:hypothetical protein